MKAILIAITSLTTTLFVTQAEAKHHHHKTPTINKIHTDPIDPVGIIDYGACVFNAHTNQDLICNRQNSIGG